MINAIARGNVLKAHAKDSKQIWCTKIFRGFMDLSMKKKQIATYIAEIIYSYRYRFISKIVFHHSKFITHCLMIEFFVNSKPL